MSNSVYLLQSQPPAQPDTFVVMGSFRGAGAPVTPVPYAGTAPVAGDYMELDQSAATAPEVIALADGAAGDRVAFTVTDLGPGVTVTGTGLSRPLDSSDTIVVFEFDGTNWVEV